MATLRVFISSTYYDLKYVRSSLELFVESLGYDAVLSEVGAVAYTPERPLDESCYREVQSCDLYVLIVGGRYGSEASTAKDGTPRGFFDKYESVTRLEYKAAVEKDIPIYILIERGVHAEFQTYQKNRDNQGIRYAHVDSVNVFRLIEDILSQPRNNPVHAFDKYVDIETWLRLQWAGLYRELLQRSVGQQQISSLAAQVGELSEVSTTLRRYLEEVIARVSPKPEALEIVADESERLRRAQLTSALERNSFVRFFTRSGTSVDVLREALESATTSTDVLAILEKQSDPKLAGMAAWRPASDHRLWVDINEARVLLGLTPFPLPAAEAQVDPTTEPRE